MKVIILSAFTAFLLTGCYNLAPEYKIPDVAQYKQYTIGYETAEWWKKLNNKELNTLIEKAKLNNVDLKRSELAIQVANENIKEADYSLWPSLSASLSKNTQKTEDKFLKNWSATMSILSYEIDYLNKRDLAEKIVNSNYEIEKTRLAVLNDIIAFSVANEYFKVKSYDNQILMLTKKAINTNQLVEIHKKRYEVGLDTTYTSSDYILQLKNIESELVTTQKLRNTAILNLKELLNDKDFEIDTAFVDSDIKYINTLTNVPSSVIDNRLDIKISELTLKAQNANIGMAKAAFFPKITLISNIGLQNGSLSNITSSNTLWQVKPDLTYNIFNGMSDYVKYQNSKTEYEQLLIDYSKTVRNAFLEIQYNIDLFNILDENKKSKDEALAIAGSKYNIVQEKRRVGLLSFKEELIEDNLFINEQITREKAILEKNIATITLMHSLI